MVADLAMQQELGSATAETAFAAAATHWDVLDRLEKTSSVCARRTVR